MAEIILASASPRRRELLALAGVDFTVKVADVEEIIPENASPDEVVKSLAMQKAQAVAKDNPDSIVIGSDTVVALGNTILGKPKDEENAVEKAIEKMMQSPLLGGPAELQRSDAVIFTVIGGPQLSLGDAKKALDLANKQVAVFVFSFCL